MEKHKHPTEIVLDPDLLKMMQGISKLSAQYWPGVSGGLSRQGKVWYSNTNGTMPERLGITLEEVEAYMKANPKTQDGEMKKFEKTLLSLGFPKR